MSASTLRYRLRFHSDWHIGSGVGRPKAVDRLVLRHAQDDLPYVPGKSITGVWREACEVVARGLDEGNDGGSWQRWVASMFGGRIHGPSGGRATAKRIRIGAARFDDSFRAALAARPHLKSTVTHVVPGVCIDETTGRAQDDMLRFTEMSRAGSVLFGDVELVGLREDEATTILALLHAGATWVEGVGGKRRRGAGRCDLSLVEPAGEDVLALLSGRPPELPQGGAAYALATHDFAESSADEWLQVDLTLDAVTPLVIADRAAGNVIRCLPFIPGSVLLPAVLQRLRDRTGFDADAAARRGDLIVTNATLEIDGIAGLPFPRSLVQDKKDPDAHPGMRNRLLEADEENGRPMEAPSQAFVGAFDGAALPRWKRPRLGTTTHSVIDEQVQRPTAAVGGVFTYEWLHPGTRFRAQLLMRGSQAYGNVDLEDCLAGQIRVGRAWDEYGALRIQARQLQRRPGEAGHVARADDQLFVWLLSDVLLDDNTIAPATSESALRAALEGALGVRLVRRSSVTDDNRRNAMLGTVRRESWSNAWGLPRASLVAISAGGVAAYTVVTEAGTPLDAAWRAALTRKLDEVSKAGIGLRRGEGFGRLRFNDPLLTTSTSSLPRPDDPPPGREVLPNATPLEMVDTALTQALERRAWRDAIERAVRGGGPRNGGDHASKDAPPSWLASAALPFTTKNPGNAQLGALRTVLAQAVRAENGESARQVFRRWSESVRRVPERLKKWEPTSGHSPLKTLDELFADRERVWAMLQLDESALHRLTLRTSNASRLKDELWVEAIQALVLQAIRQSKRPLSEVRDA